MFLNRKVSLGAAIAMLLVAATVVFSVTMTYSFNSFNARVQDLREREQLFDKYAELNLLVTQNYNGEINSLQLEDNVARGFMAGIDDAYSRYLTAAEYKRYIEDTRGDNAGIGAVIELSPDDFYLQIMEVYPDSPAEVAGIRAGDLIIKIDDTDLSRENSRQMLDSIEGPAGSNITLVTRRGNTDSSPLVMTRRAVAVPTVLNAKLLQDSSVGYLRISAFHDRTYDQFNRELLRLMDAGASSLIIDLRDNDSDTLRSAARILDKLLGEGALVSAVYKDGSSAVLYESDANQIDLPVVVLINNRTTGVGEVFAQAVRDFDKGRTVGATTAGKGVMLSMFQLSDGSAIELPVATYHTSSGQSFHGVGVKPDFDVQMETDWTKLPDDESADPQLVKAKEVAVGMQKTSGEPVPDPGPQPEESVSASGEESRTTVSGGSESVAQEPEDSRSDASASGAENAGGSDG